jgi:hypothetical protein
MMPASVIAALAPPTFDEAPDQCCESIDVK